MTKSVREFFFEDHYCGDEEVPDALCSTVAPTVWNIVVCQAIEDPVTQQVELVEDALWLAAMP